MTTALQNLSGFLAMSPDWATRDRLAEFEARMKNADMPASQAAAFTHLHQAAVVNFRQLITSDTLFVRAGTVAIIPIWGVLVNRFSYCVPWATGYNYIRDALAQAMGDDTITEIVLDVNSPGGDVSGLPETSAAVTAAAKTKRVTAAIDSLSASAAYYICSGASQIVATTNSMIGSIGTLWLHYSISRLLDQAGVDPTFIHSGAYKVETWPEQQMTDGAKARMQSTVDAFAADFYEAVATNRGKTADEVKSLEAAVFRADEAMAKGLIDAVLSPEMSLGDFLTIIPEGTKAMTTQTAATTEAETAEAVRVATAAATASAVAGERQRVAAIMGAEAAQKRPKLAAALAAQGVNADTAIALLAVAAEESAPLAASPLDGAMDRTGGGAGVGTGAEATGQGGKEPTEAEQAQAIHRDWMAARKDDPMTAHLRK